MGHLHESQEATNSPDDGSAWISPAQTAPIACSASALDASPAGSATGGEAMSGTVANAHPELREQRAALMSHWADSPASQEVRSPFSSPAVSRARHSVPHKSGQYETGFARLTAGEHGHSIAENRAPAQMLLPKEMTQGMQTAWNQSMPVGDSQEQGGLLVRNRDGSLKWQPFPSGMSGSIVPDYEAVDRNQRLVALGHTHPYSKQEGGFTHVPFSGRDLAETVNEQERLNIVQSGDGLFGSARTREFDELVKARGEDGKEALSAEIEQCWNTFYRGAQGDLRQRAEVATRLTSERYHLLYYAGQNGRLRLVEPPRASAHKGNKDHAHP